MIDRLICRLFGHLWVNIKCNECGSSLQNFNLAKGCYWCHCGQMYRHGSLYGCATHSSGVHECARCGRLEWLR